MCGVCGNMSTGRTAATRYRAPPSPAPAQSAAQSRACGAQPVKYAQQRNIKHDKIKHDNDTTTAKTRDCRAVAGLRAALTGGTGPGCTPPLIPPAPAPAASIPRQRKPAMAGPARRRARYSSRMEGMSESSERT